MGNEDAFLDIPNESDSEEEELQDCIDSGEHCKRTDEEPDKTVLCNKCGYVCYPEDLEKWAC